MKRFIGNRKETLSSICAVDDKADLIVKKQPVSRDKQKSGVAADHGNATSSRSSVGERESSKENRRMVSATRKLTSGTGNGQVRDLYCVIFLFSMHCSFSSF